LEFSTCSKVSIEGATELTSERRVISSPNTNTKRTLTNNRRSFAPFSTRSVSEERKKPLFSSNLLGTIPTINATSKVETDTESFGTLRSKNLSHLNEEADEGRLLTCPGKLLKRLGENLSEKGGLLQVSRQKSKTKKVGNTGSNQFVASRSFAFKSAEKGLRRNWGKIRSLRVEKRKSCSGGKKGERGKGTKGGGGQKGMKMRKVSRKGRSMWVVKAGMQSAESRGVGGISEVAERGWKSRVVRVKSEGRGKKGVIGWGGNAVKKGWARVGNGKRSAEGLTLGKIEGRGLIQNSRKKGMRWVGRKGGREIKKREGGGKGGWGATKAGEARKLRGKPSLGRIRVKIMGRSGTVGGGTQKKAKKGRKQGRWERSSRRSKCFGRKGMSAIEGIGIKSTGAQIEGGSRKSKETSMIKGITSKGQGRNSNKVNSAPKKNGKSWGKTGNGAERKTCDPVCRVTTERGGGSGKTRSGEGGRWRNWNNWRGLRRRLGGRGRCLKRRETRNSRRRREGKGWKNARGRGGSRRTRKTLRKETAVDWSRGGGSGKTEEARRNTLGKKGGRGGGRRGKKRGMRGLTRKDSGGEEKAETATKTTVEGARLGNGSFVKGQISGSKGSHGEETKKIR
jgi:hypothetical protein